MHLLPFKFADISRFRAKNDANQGALSRVFFVIVRLFDLYLLVEKSQLVAAYPMPNGSTRLNNISKNMSSFV